MSRDLDIKLDQILFWKPDWSSVCVRGNRDTIETSYEPDIILRSVLGRFERLPKYSSNWEDAQLALEEMWRRGYDVKTPIPTTPEEISKIIFEKLGAEKRVEFENHYRGYNTFSTRIQSDPGARLNHPRFIEIVKMGKEVLPFIFEKIRIAYQGIDFLFMALPEITGEDIVIPQEMRGKLRLICNTWLQWGKEHGY